MPESRWYPHPAGKRPGAASSFRPSSSAARCRACRQLCHTSTATGVNACRLTCCKRSAIILVYSPTGASTSHGANSSTPRTSQLTGRTLCAQREDREVTDKVQGGTALERQQKSSVSRIRRNGRMRKIADEIGVGIVTADNAFHYLWDGGYW